MARKVGPIGRIEDGVSAPKRGSAGGHAKYAKSTFFAVRTQIKNEYEAWLKNEGQNDESRDEFAERMQIKYGLDVDAGIGVVLRYMREVDKSKT